MVIGDTLTNNAHRLGRFTSFIDGERRFTWAETNARVNALAGSLLALGLKKGDPVGLFARNSYRSAEAFFALHKAGLIMVPLSPLASGAEVAAIGSEVNMAAILCEDQLSRVVEGVRDRMPDLRHLIAMGPEHDWPLDADALVAAGRPDEPPVVVRGDDIRAIKFTSGTTGRPKGVVSLHLPYLLGVLNWLALIPHSRLDTAMVLLPFTAGVGANMLTGYAYAGCPTVIVPRFDPLEALALIERHRVATMFLAVPTMLQAFLQCPRLDRTDLSSLRHIGYGGAPAPPRVVMEGLSRFGCEFYQGLGSAEAGGLFVFLMPEDHRPGPGQEQRLSACGREAPHVRVRFCDEEGRELPEGEAGELQVRGPGTMPCYWNDPEATAQAYQDGWLRTGDIGYRGQDGLVYLVDRKDDTIITGGLNVYPAEVEKVLYTHPAVSEVSVVGLPHAHWGQEVVAMVVLRPGERADESDLLAWCRDRLAKYKVPKRVVFSAEPMPKNISDKISRKQIRQLLLKEVPAHGQAPAQE